jgi:hemoglobin
MRFQLGFVLVLALAPIMAAGCPWSSSDARGAREGPRSTRRLYVRLGGVDGIRVVVDELVSRMAGDPRIHQFFVKTDFRHFKSQLVIQLCQLSGGPCRYRGRPMRDIHRGRRIRDVHFQAMLEDASAALQAAKVGTRERRELLALLRALRPQIVEPGK